MNPEILEARGDAHIESCNSHDRRLERIGVIADYLFRVVIEDDHKTFPSEIVSAVAFLADEIHDSREEQAHIQENLRAAETRIERYAADIHTLRPMRGEPIPF